MDDSMSDADILGKPTFAADTECYKDYWLCEFLPYDLGPPLVFEMYEGHPLDLSPMLKVIRESKLITFNGANYDAPMIFYAIHLIKSGEHSIRDILLLLKQASDLIIVGGVKPWELSNKFGFKISDRLDMIDVAEPAPGVLTSLKLYAGRMHTPTMEDLPYKPSDSITAPMRAKLVTYCRNDCFNTLLLYKNLSQQISLREAMSEEYGIDLRSKSDAQVAEAVIKQEVCKLMKVDYIKRPEMKAGWKFRYRAPPAVKFETPDLARVLEEVQSLDFVLSAQGKPLMPKGLEGRIVTIGGVKFKMGMGGLHSQEECQSLFSTKTVTIKDRDVASYYPFIIIRNALYPKQMGMHFLHVYSKIVMDRLDAKAKGEKVKADSLKITINGSFGKLGSRFSALFAPDLMIEVTVTGQLYLLMLIERFTIAGIKVRSANTDGVVFEEPNDRTEEVLAIIRQWERDTGMETEETIYRSLHSRDVNNYVALAIDPKNGDIKVKTKGVFKPTDLQKNPNCSIIGKACVEFFLHGTPIEKTIRECDDIRQFVKVITVSTGAYWRLEYLGKVVRFYKSAGNGDVIKNLKGDKVQLSDGARPLMTLPDVFPKDIDYAWYEQEARDLLRESGIKLDSWFLFDGWF
jgi:hypothetical protein